MASQGNSGAAGPSMAAAVPADATMAQRTFELNNDMITLDASDSIFYYESMEQRRIGDVKPWKKDPHYFQKVRISAVALIKMVMHARSGGIYEIMGLMQGKVDDKTQTMYIMDAFALPVEGTETRVNAQNDAYEYMVQYQDAGKSVERLENAIGWYHSHPGYGCWLSGIDVETQLLNQTYQEPWVAIVVDPNRTMSAGKVDIGAFRTYPAGYTPPTSTEESEYQSIPLNKIEDFGVHANQYYQLKVEIFKSSAEDKLLSLLWNKYWVSTLSQSPLIVNRSYTAGQVKDLAEKIARTTHKLAGRSGVATQGASGQGSSLDLRPDDRQSRRQMLGSQDAAVAGSSDSQGKAPLVPASDAQSAQKSGKAPERPDMHPKIQAAMQELAKRDAETPLSQAAKDAAKIASEAKAGLISQVMKDIVFNKSAAGLQMPPLS